MPRGILKQSKDQGGSSSRLRWDEDNLMITESQKNATMKITEPKTPFIHYNIDTDEITGNSGSIPPMELSAALANAKGFADSTGSIMSSSDSDSMKGRSNSSDWESTDEDEEHLTEEERERRKKFAKLRSQHYNMKAALQTAKKLVEKELSSGDEDDEDEQGHYDREEEGDEHYDDFDDDEEEVVTDVKGKTPLARVNGNTNPVPSTLPAAAQTPGTASSEPNQPQSIPGRHPHHEHHHHVHYPPEQLLPHLNGDTHQQALPHSTETRSESGALISSASRDMSSATSMSPGSIRSSCQSSMSGKMDLS
ncbi:hypothetical protein HDU76_010227 [Blyttiomyces sp. JEL0837]|nr:hypothetical protein HDU76_010227 [Blyttiomyces sp. JEL0837]